MDAILNTEILLLNRDYDATKVISARKALMMLVRGAAEAIDVDSDGQFYPYDFESWCELGEYKAEFESTKYKWIKLVHGMLAIPSIVRTAGVGYRRQSLKFNRRNIYARDCNICQYCGKKFQTHELSLDHIIPRSRGGENNWMNIVCACLRCNMKKAARTPVEANMRLIRQPFKPSQPFQLPKAIHWSWKDFVDTAYWNVELK